MSTFHSDMEQSLGLFVCFCKTLMYFYGVRERAFQQAVLHSLQERMVHGLARAWIVLPLGTLLALAGGCRGACVQGRRSCLASMDTGFSWDWHCCIITSAGAMV